MRTEHNVIKWWKVWVLGITRRAASQALQTAVPVLALALSSGALTGGRAAVALGTGLAATVGVTVGRFVLGAVLSIKLPVDAPRWVRVAVKAGSAAVGVVAAVWPLDWAGFDDVAWSAAGWSALLAAVLSLAQAGLEALPDTDDAEPFSQISSTGRVSVEG